MRFDRVNLEKIIFDFLIYSSLAIFNCKIWLKNRKLPLRFIKSDKNYRILYLNSITVALYFLYTLSYQMKFQFKSFDGPFHNNQKLFLFAQVLANFWWLLKIEIDTFSDKKSRFIKNSENVWAKSLFEQIYTYKKYNSSDRLFKYTFRMSSNTYIIDHYNPSVRITA